MEIQDQELQYASFTGREMLGLFHTQGGFHLGHRRAVPPPMLSSLSLPICFIILGREGEREVEEGREGGKEGEGEGSGGREEGERGRDLHLFPPLLLFRH